MGFKDAVISCLQHNYAGFDGRAPRSEYWYFYLFAMLILAALFILYAILRIVAGATIGMVIAVSLALIWLIALFVPSLAAQVRRLHDTNASGWFLLLALIPYAGGLIMLVWFCIPGTRGTNRFGPDPLNPTDVDAFQ